MAGITKDKRQLRRDVLRQFENTFDVGRYNYAQKIRPIQGKSKLIGIGAAVLLYSAAFSVAYFSWTGGRVSYEIFMKTTWVLLLPASVLGVVSWMVAFNRMENALCAPLMTLIRATEGETGMLWRYAPLLGAVDPHNLGAKKACNASRERRMERIEPDEYSVAVQTLHKALAHSADQPLPSDVLREVEDNLALVGLDPVSTSSS